MHRAGRCAPASGGDEAIPNGNDFSQCLCFRHQPTRTTQLVVEQFAHQQRRSAPHKWPLLSFRRTARAKVTPTGNCRTNLTGWVFPKERVSRTRQRALGAVGVVKRTKGVRTVCTETHFTNISGEWRKKWGLVSAVDVSSEHWCGWCVGVCFANERKCSCK